MLDRELIRREPDLVRDGIFRKGGDAALVDEFLQTDRLFRTARARAGDLQAEANRTAKSIGQLIASGKRDEADAAKAQASELKAQVAAAEHEERVYDADLRALELRFPNLPHASVPEGLTEEANRLVRTWGEKPDLPNAQPHWEIGERLGILDSSRGVKVAGSGFMLYVGMGARLQRALINWMVDLQTSRGYVEVFPPYLVNTASLIGTGNLPKFEEELYRTQDDLFLIPTAEVPVTNLYRDEILPADKLPIRLAAYSACFRREAGAAGKDTRGLLRVHQFDKVELVKMVRPEESYAELESLIGDAEAVLQALGVHYRVVELCAGEVGDKGAKCYDLEAWSPGVGRYLELSSCTNFEAFQSRRANIRFRVGEEKPEFLHILNGSGVATPRLLAALLETYTEADGAFLVPEPLRSYVGSDRIEPAPGL